MVISSPLFVSSNEKAAACFPYGSVNSNTLTSNKMFGIIVKGGADVAHANANVFKTNGKNN
ncbi:MAG: hypothetical protein II653_01105, partial [Lachnospiraceae bacterium]|nr:hypothetical protein [Lachnospiraceae bacterium]